MNSNNEKQIVKYDGKWWMLESVSESGMATIWRNGQPALIPNKYLIYPKEDM